MSAHGDVQQSDKAHDVQLDNNTNSESNDGVDLLIVGAGWVGSSFLLPLLRRQASAGTAAHTTGPAQQTSNLPFENFHLPPTPQPLTYAATTRTGHDGTLPFAFDPAHDTLEDPSEATRTKFSRLPCADTVLVTFPLRGIEQARTLVGLYERTHPAITEQKQVRWILLGATSIYTAPTWNDELSEYDNASPRAQAEDYILSLSASQDTTTATARSGGCVLNLAGLYGGQSRDPANWLSRVAPTKDALRQKGALHLVHGWDVARTVLWARARWDQVVGKRWLVTDRWVYDWWGLALEFESALKAAEKTDDQYMHWISELMVEEGVRGLPRSEDALGRKLDGRAFWRTVGSQPLVARLDRVL